MDRNKAQQYSPLANEPHDIPLSIEDSYLKDEIEETLYHSATRKARVWHALHRIISYGGILLVVSLISFYSGWNLSLKHPQNAHIDTAWHELKNQISYIPYTFDPHFVTPPSDYMGQPNPELDKKWYHLAELRNFAVDYETLVRANKSKAAVQWPGTHTYQAGLEAFHQLHCLNYIRMYTYMDYYSKIDFDMLHEPLEERTEHKDHCIDVLRQHLMCAPDLNIYTFHWTKHSSVPFFDLKTNHECIDWNKFDAWAVSQMIHEGVPQKPLDSYNFLD